MSCNTCSTKAGKPTGCKSNGGCTSGGCNRKNTFDWLSDISSPATDNFDLIEVSFKQGARKDFFHNSTYVGATKGQMVVVEAGNGFDIGEVSLTGELVRLQLKKRKLKESMDFQKVIRVANERDMVRLAEARKLEKPTLIRARVIARTLGLVMKIGDIEYQGDKKKATFFYTARGRVDFRELIRHYAKEFKVKVEMRQIGARQETSRIGGIGSCGRELCCSTWLYDFKSVNTAAARYQNLSINQTKLSGMCGRLKCCLNYELDTYIDALKGFPKRADYLHTKSGKANLVKTDVFKREMVYFFQPSDKSTRGSFVTLSPERVFEILQLNKNKEKPLELQDASVLADIEEDNTPDFDAINDVIDLPIEKRRKRRKKRGGKQNNKSTAPTNDKQNATKNPIKEGNEDTRTDKEDKTIDKNTNNTQEGNKNRRGNRRPSQNNRNNRNNANKESNTSRNRNKRHRNKREDNSTNKNDNGNNDDKS